MLRDVPTTAICSRSLPNICNTLLVKMLGDVHSLTSYNDAIKKIDETHHNLNQIHPAILPIVIEGVKKST